MVSVILAAGRGRRMGQPKALLTWRGHTFLEHLVTVSYAAGIRNIVIVTQPDLRDRLTRGSYPLPASESEMWLDLPSHREHFSAPPATSDLHVEWVESDADAEQLVSLQKAWHHIADRQPSGILVGPVDQGPYPVSLLHALLAHFEPHARQAWVPVFHGKRGHPVLLGGGLLPCLETSHPHGLRGILQDHQDVVSEVPVESSACLRNLNTPLLYQQFLQQTNG